MFSKGKKGVQEYPGAEISGWMMKKGHVRRNWKERFFILKGNTISYYEKPPKNDKAEPLGKIPLHNGNIGKMRQLLDGLGKASGYLFFVAFEIPDSNREWYFISDGLTEERSVIVHNSIGAAGRRKKEFCCSGTRYYLMSINLSDGDNADIIEKFVGEDR